MLRVLQGEESLRQVSEIAAGNGLIKKPERDAMLNGWRRDARMGTTPRQRQTLDMLVAPGLAVREVKKGERLPEWRHG